MDGREDRSKTERLLNSRRIRQNGTKTENTPILVVICENRFQERAKRKNFYQNVRIYPSFCQAEAYRESETLKKRGSAKYY